MAKCHCAGTSCTAFASIGKQLGVRDATVLPFLVWVGHRIALQEPLVLHENSKLFPIAILQRFLGHLYYIESDDVEAHGYGCPVRRERKITRLYHKVKAVIIEKPFSRFNLRFQRVCRMTWREYFCQHMCKTEESKANGEQMRKQFQPCSDQTDTSWFAFPNRSNGQTAL